MSANNWRVCPKCVIKKNTERAREYSEVEQSYGKVPEREYRKMLNDLADNKVKHEETLREDFEIGIDGHEFYVDYSARCGECGFCFKFKKTERLEIE